LFPLDTIKTSATAPHIDSGLSKFIKVFNDPNNDCFMFIEILNKYQHLTELMKQNHAELAYNLNNNQRSIILGI
jgi:hypothetical protein